MTSAEFNHIMVTKRNNLLTERALMLWSSLTDREKFVMRMLRVEGGVPWGNFRALLKLEELGLVYCAALASVSHRGRDLWAFLTPLGYQTVWLSNR